MSEMLANQFFISGRYSEAYEEYSRLPKEKRDGLSVKEKIIISATINENFENALSLLHELITNDLKLFNGTKIEEVERACLSLLNKLENMKELRSENEKEMKIAILLFFSDRDNSLKHFQKLTNSCYADIINPFLTELKKIIN